ncbi:hypothetical protein BH23ACT9_BH23ACT9_21390 [soil metagenome]
MGVDFDPRSVQDGDWAVPVLFGDAEDLYLPSLLPLGSTRWVISTLRDVDANLLILRSFSDHGYAGKIAMSADDEDAEQRLRDAGADMTIQPLQVAAGPLMLRLHEHGDRSDNRDLDSTQDVLEDPA